MWSSSAYVAFAHEHTFANLYYEPFSCCGSSVPLTTAAAVLFAPATFFIAAAGAVIVPSCFLKWECRWSRCCWR